MTRECKGKVVERIESTSLALEEVEECELEDQDEGNEIEKLERSRGMFSFAKMKASGGCHCKKVLLLMHPLMTSTLK